jgi:hypothetical protein
MALMIVAWDSSAGWPKYGHRSCQPAGSSEPTWTDILSASSGALSALVLIIGAVLAQRYLTRGNAAVEATVFRYAGGLGLRVKPVIQSLGFAPLRLVHNDADFAPVVGVAEYRTDGAAGPPQEIRRETFQGDDLVGPGETISSSEIFLVPPPEPATLGWQVIFEVGVRKRFHRKMYWRWIATTFVPVPEDLQSGPRPKRSIDFQA